MGRFVAFCAMSTQCGQMSGHLMNKGLERGHLVRLLVNTQLDTLMPCGSHSTWTFVHVGGHVDYQALMTFSCCFARVVRVDTLEPLYNGACSRFESLFSVCVLFGMVIVLVTNRTTRKLNICKALICSYLWISVSREM